MAVLLRFREFTTGCWRDDGVPGVVAGSPAGALGVLKAASEFCIVELAGFGVSNSESEDFTSFVFGVFGQIVDVSDFADESVIIYSCLQGSRFCKSNNLYTFENICK
jgi:hypothetical protein